MLFTISIICFNLTGNEKPLHYKRHFNKNVFAISVFYCIFHKSVHYIKVNFIKKNWLFDEFVRIFCFYQVKLRDCIQMKLLINNFLKASLKFLLLSSTSVKNKFPAYLLRWQALSLQQHFSLLNWLVWKLKLLPLTSNILPTTG